MASLPSLAVSGAAAAAAAKLDSTDQPIRKLPPSSSSSFLLDKKAPPAPTNGALAARPPPPVDPFRGDLEEGSRFLDPSAYVPLLRRCAAAASKADADALHGHFLKTELRANSHIGTSMVNAYMKCGAVELARQLFDEMPFKHIDAWTTLISGYMHNALPDLAFACFIEMLELGMYPTCYTLGTVMSACSALNALAFGEQVHGYMVKYAIDTVTAPGNALCNFYRKCGSFESAMKAFRRVGDKNVISWTTVISACAETGDTDLGLRLFIDMLREHVKPSALTLSGVLKLCCVRPDLHLGKQVHGLCAKSCYESNIPIQNSIMYLYLKSGEIDNAKRVLADMGDLNLITRNALIAGYAGNMISAKDDIAAYANGIEALWTFLELHRSGIKPDMFSYSSVLNVCSGLLALLQGEQIHSQVIKNGLLHDAFVNSGLINMYNKCGAIEQAEQVFAEAPLRNIISWTAMLTGYSQHGRSKDAIRLFEEMRLAGVWPNQVSFVSVLAACSLAGLVDEAERYFEMMTNEYHIKPVVDHHACMVDMFVRLGRLEDAFLWVKRMDVEPNEIVWSILISGCRSLGSTELGFYAAEQLLRLKPTELEMQLMLLNMYLPARRWEEVSRVQKLMKEEKVGILKDRSWIDLKGQTHCFLSDDQSHPQTEQIYEYTDKLLKRARELGYEPYGEGPSVGPSDDEENGSASVMIHHSEILALAFGLISSLAGTSLRITKNMSMCKRCHGAFKAFSAIEKREIVVRDSKRLHKFRDGRCSCGDFFLPLLNRD